MYLFDMYFRLKKTPNGQVLQLIESFRDPLGRPRHRIVISLGNASIPADDRPIIAKMVENNLYGYEELLKQPHPQRIQSWVSSIVRRVDKYGKWHPLRSAPPVGQCDADVSSGAKEKPADVVDGVIVDKVSHTATAPLGAQLAGYAAWKELDLFAVLADAGFNDSQQQAAAVSVVSRLTDAQPEYRLGEWFEQSSMPELLGGGSLRGVISDDRFYRVSDRLVAARARIENHLRRRQQEMFSIERTVLLYDLTNTHFEGECEGNPKAARGKNKQKRNDCPQVSIGMVFDQEGFELAHKVFEGNRHDAATLAEMIAELDGEVAQDPSLFSSQKPLVIVDAGIATRKNLDFLHARGFSYLVNDSRRGRGAYEEQFSSDEGFSPIPGRSEGEAVLVKCVSENHGSAPVDSTAAADSADERRYTERVLLCKSRARGQKEEAILSMAEKRFVAELQKLASRIEKGRLIDEKKVQRIIGRIQARHPRAQRYYAVELTAETASPTAARRLRLLYGRHDEAFDRNRDLAGCYVLRTDRSDFTPERIWRTYMTLTKAEDGFRALKSHLGLRPNFHRRETRVDGHIFISVLAYHLMRFITARLERVGDHRNWDSLRRVLQPHSYTTIVLPTKDGLVHRIRKAGDPEECQKAIYRNLGIDWKNLPVIRTVVQQKTKATL